MMKEHQVNIMNATTPCPACMRMRVTLAMWVRVLVIGAAVWVMMATLAAMMAVRCELPAA